MARPISARSQQQPVLGRIHGGCQTMLFGLAVKCRACRRAENSVDGNRLSEFDEQHLCRAILRACIDPAKLLKRTINRVGIRHLDYFRGADGRVGRTLT